MTGRRANVVTEPSTHDLEDHTGEIDPTDSTMGARTGGETAPQRHGVSSW